MKMIPSTFLLITLLCVLPPPPVACKKNMLKHLHKEIHQISDGKIYCSYYLSMFKRNSSKLSQWVNLSVIIGCRSSSWLIKVLMSYFFPSCWLLWPMQLQLQLQLQLSIIIEECIASEPTAEDKIKCIISRTENEVPYCLPCACIIVCRLAPELCSICPI